MKTSECPKPLAKDRAEQARLTEELTGLTFGD
jgi:hypothetical protein